MTTRVNLVGRRYSRLIVLELHEVRNNKAYWLCQCDCGNTKIVQTTQLNQNKVKSCGCMRKEQAIINGKDVLGISFFKGPKPHLRKPRKSLICDKCGETKIKYTTWSTKLSRYIDHYGCKSCLILAAYDRKLKRRGIKNMANGNGFTKSEFDELCEHYGNMCLCCGATDKPLAADHVIPISTNGWDDIRNIQPLCKSCNSKKKNKAIDYRPLSDIFANIIESPKVEILHDIYL